MHRQELQGADETKNWKFRLGDLDDRAKWDDFTKAYDWLVARTIADAMEKLDLRYPPADPAVLKMGFD